MQINDREEYNCLMRHGLKEETLTWYWTDGNDVANSGVWTHARDDSDMLFFPPRVQCTCSDDEHSCSGDAFMLNMLEDKRRRGNYCDYSTNSARHFICEAVI